MHSLSKSKKKRIIRDIIIGARLYGKFLVPHDFLIVSIPLMEDHSLR